LVRIRGLETWNNCQFFLVHGCDNIIPTASVKVQRAEYEYICCNRENSLGLYGDRCADARRLPIDDFGFQYLYGCLKRNSVLYEWCQSWNRILPFFIGWVTQ
jgi:hypothetical protein